MSTTFKDVMKSGVPRSYTTKLKPEYIRKIKLKDNIPKMYWYSVLKGKYLMAYLFKKYYGAISVSFPLSEFISGKYFEVVKYADKRNKDFR